MTVWYRPGEVRYKPKEFTRDVLYRLAWERPVLGVAKEIGVSDVAVAKGDRIAESHRRVEDTMKCLT